MDDEIYFKDLKVDIIRKRDGEIIYEKRKESGNIDGS